MRQIAPLLIVAALALQAQGTRSFVGTVAGFRPESAAIEIRPDAGDPVVAKVTPDTIAQKIAPGEKDLKKAEALNITDIAKGDRVLVTLEPDSPNLRRIVVMSAADIARRNDADRLDWQKRGLAGIVASKSGTQITLKTRTMTGEVESVVTVTGDTVFRRYAPDSVRFSDARASKLAEVGVGDQLRARGQKSEDGLKVAAEEIVFGTFLVKAGSISAIDAAGRQLNVKELGTNKTLTVKLTADSQVKQMPAMPPMMMGGDGRAGMPGGGFPPGGRGGSPGGFDINQMIERMPASTLEDLKPGATVVVASTKGAKADQLTAILVLSNADMLIRMASAGNGANRGGMAAGGMNGPGMGGMMGGDAGGLSGLGLGGIIP
ncbi:MAG TPA: hypothetical protein VMS37_35640 [Verrucomicrobiae bacterium]|nr:hypothetical protein [Verrucomicrobiae bacterium]